MVKFSPSPSVKSQAVISWMLLKPTKEYHFNIKTDEWLSAPSTHSFFLLSAIRIYEPILLLMGENKSSPKHPRTTTVSIDQQYSAYNTYSKYSKNKVHLLQTASASLDRPFPSRDACGTQNSLTSRTLITQQRRQRHFCRILPRNTHLLFKPTPTFRIF